MRYIFVTVSVDVFYVIRLDSCVSGELLRQLLKRPSTPWLSMTTTTFMRMLSVDVIIVTVRNYISTIRPIFETRYGSYVF